MKSRTQKASSSTVQDESRASSVYDFLYHDPQRIASFLAQFDENGHLTQVIQKAAKKVGSTDSGAASGHVGVPLVGGGNVNMSIANSSSSEREGQRTYDPLWSNSLLLLEYLNDQNLIKRHLPTTSMGQMVLVRGDLWVIDLGLMKEIFSSQNVLDAFASQAGVKGTGEPDVLKLGANLISIIPHVTQAVLDTPSGLIWSSLNSAGLTMPSADLLMKHGFSVGGKWSMLGLLDALPDKTTPPAPPAALGPYVGGLVSLAPALRPMLGRPASAYGITPLLIFREVT